MQKLTEKQRRFVDYFVETGNAAEAARQAGYGEKTARMTGAKNLAKTYVREAIDDRLAELQSKRVANAQEVMEYLTAVMRGEIKEEVIVVEGAGDGCSSARRMNKQVGVRDRNKAAEMLAKRYGLQVDKVILDQQPVVIGGEDDLED